MIVVSALMLTLLAAVPQDTGARAAPLIISGGTIVDVRDYGSSARDLRDAVVVIERGKITAVGPRASTKTPAGSRKIDARGKYIVPGYIDGFASLANQAFANANLYMGVTSVVAALPDTGDTPARTPDARRAPTFVKANPSPRLFFLGIVLGAARDGDSLRLLSDAETVAQLEGEARSGANVVLLHYFVGPTALWAAESRARQLGVATIGELGATTYYEAEDAGVAAFVHTSRYSIELAPPPLRAQVARRPSGPPRMPYYRYLTALQPNDSSISRYAARLGAGRTLLMPTLALWYLYLRDHENPWREPVAAMIDPAMIHLPADRVTGAAAAPADTMRDGFPAGMAEAMLALERRYRAAGARYLTGSGVSAFGTMPGISLHTELELLVRIGLTPRQALAAATWNFSRLAPWSSLGAIAPGRDADVLILDADPTQDIRNAKRIHAVILGGQPLNLSSLLARGRDKAF
jgi:hypothetical protein